MAASDGLGGRVQRRRGRRRRSSFRLHKPKWVDPFPEIPGTEAEKRIFAELVQRRIYFRFQFDIDPEELDLSGWIQPVGFHPDFIVPEYHVIIDPFSDFHHTLPEAIARDKKKKALFEAMGYKTYFPWHTDVLAKGASQILDRVEEFRHPPKRQLEKGEDVAAKRTPGFRLGPHLGLGSKSVAAANRARARHGHPLPKNRGGVARRRGRKRRGL